MFTELAIALAALFVALGIVGCGQPEENQSVATDHQASAETPESPLVGGSHLQRRLPPVTPLALKAHQRSKMALCGKNADDKKALHRYALYKYSIEGWMAPSMAVMPAKGGNDELSDAQVMAAVDYMLWSATGRLNEQ